jgi:hypothetical protein
MQTLSAAQNRAKGAVVVQPANSGNSDWTMWLVVLFVQVLFAAGLWAFVKYKKNEASKTHLF